MKRKELQSLYNLKTFRYVVAGLSLILAINGCEPVYFEADESLQRLHQQEKRELRVLTLRHPLIYSKHKEGRSPRATGIDHDLLHDFAHRYGFKLQFIEYKDEGRLFEALAKNEGDIIASRLRG